jgi:hypothetical protein
VTLSPGDTVTLQGTTAGAKDDYMSFCADTTADADNNDVVVGVDLTAPCTLTVTLDDGGNFDGAISERHADCTMRGAGDGCQNLSPSGTVETYKENAAAELSYYVIDSADGGSGDFSLTIKCEVPVCGDGVINAGEECDGGGANPDDSCGDPGAANACKIEAAIAADTCADATTVIDVTNASDVVLPMTAPLFNNATAADDYQPLDNGCSHEAGGLDQVFAVRALGAGTLSASLEAENAGPVCTPPDFVDPTCRDRLVYIRTACGDQNSQVSCVNTFDEEPVNAASASVLLNQTVYVFVDGYNGDTMFDNGAYAIRFHLAP